MSPGVKAYFADPVKAITEKLTRLQRKFEFQGNMRVHLLKHLIKEKEKKRQMESYFRKKGQEFEAQKKKLAEANAWIQTAERKLQASEEEKQKVQREMEELQEKLKNLSTSIHSQHHTSNPTQFSFMPEESQEPGIAPSVVNSTPNSTFDLVSPLVISPAPSLNSSNFHTFFENGNVASNGSEAAFNDDLMFNTMSSGQSVRGANLSNSSAFSVAFNNMFTPTRNLDATTHSMANQTAVNQTIMDKTSMSLDNWRASKSNSFGTHDMYVHMSFSPSNFLIPGPKERHLSLWAM
ncbi:CRE-ZHP-3 protein [Caenorhabditis remanei]|uniref:CRE-ZHP-3 protein n=1 Tax=Caenorhabditis remanei TaxID=31234 RepID=E3LV87_CAERE|nr:CRE-ZHP-3 protein [Caenorhabditis remanei]